MIPQLALPHTQLALPILSSTLPNYLNACLISLCNHCVSFYYFTL
jgi:hypothetical protein